MRISTLITTLGKRLHPFPPLQQKLLNWLFPARCYLCSKALSAGQMICLCCQRGLPWIRRACRRCALPIETGSQCGVCLSNPPEFTACISPFLYEPPISTLIIQLKFHQRLHYARLLGELLIDAVSDQANSLPECLIPVPLHHQRIRRRGFNQAVEIAKPLSKRFNIPILYDHCHRHKNTVPQTRLSANIRRRNLSGAFSAEKDLKFTHVAIVDDVMTTGQTTRQLSRLLLTRGIQKIDIWCCARAA